MKIFAVNGMVIPISNICTIEWQRDALYVSEIAVELRNDHGALGLKTVIMI